MYWVLYGAFGWFFASTWVTSVSFPAWVVTVAPWLLPVAAAADALENALHLSLTDPRSVAAPPWLYPLAGSAAPIKVLFVLAFLPVFGAVVRAWLLEAFAGGSSSIRLRLRQRQRQRLRQRVGRRQVPCCAFFYQLPGSPCPIATA